jgi:hypothetical protein
MELEEMYLEAFEHLYFSESFQNAQDLASFWEAAGSRMDLDVDGSCSNVAGCRCHSSSDEGLSS